FVIVTGNDDLDWTQTFVTISSQFESGQSTLQRKICSLYQVKSGWNKDTAKLDASSWDWIQKGCEMRDLGCGMRVEQTHGFFVYDGMKVVTNIFQRMTKAQFVRWERIRAKGRPKYVLKRTLLYGGIIPALIIWLVLGWTTLPKLIVML